jgi:hypothetical protein
MFPQKPSATRPAKKKKGYHVGQVEKSGLHMLQKGSTVHPPTTMPSPAAPKQSVSRPRLTPPAKSYFG